ncbi:MAG: UbiA family prenyltransferase [Gammaproteobacteria bacterium]|nr:UbiA family prenyltransferase [Gammaproteobacteria bacterium]MBU1439790.1 UbiA family prenyltransferase [Gammaproteobacteria bacterium]
MPTAAPLPLYVDLDGTLIATDLLHESLLNLVRAAPLALFQLPGWLLRGKATVKREVADRTEIDVSTLPYRPEVLELVRQARADGRRTVLATASDSEQALRVAQYLGIFDAVLASDGELNLSGEHKAAAIRADAGEGGYAYAGDRQVDMAVWRDAQAAVIVSRDDSLARRAAALTQVEAHIRPAPTPFSRYLYGVRLHQWLKNVLVFLPLMPVLHDLDWDLASHAIVAFLAFGLMASGIYVLNDLLDLESDRRHKRKRFRPFAAGQIPVVEGLMMSVGLAAASLILSIALLPDAFLGVLLLYMALTSAYSFALKRRALVDVFSLAALYTLRVAAGTAAMDLPLSFWILSFSLFIFLSLALAKRYVEVSEATDAKRLKRDRGYLPSDAPYILCTGIAAGQMSVLLLSMYLQDEQMLDRYDNPSYLWILIPIFLFWTMRIWLKAVRGLLHEDPVVFAARDWVSRLAVGLGAAIIWMAG